MNIQTRIGDLKNQLKQLQEVNLAQIDRIQNLLEKTLIGIGQKGYCVHLSKTI